MVIETNDCKDIVLTLYRKKSLKSQTPHKPSREAFDISLTQGKEKYHIEENIRENPSLTVIKDIVLLLIFSFVLPIVDVYTDLVLAFTYYRRGDPNYAAVLLIPFLTNYTLTWIAWMRMPEKNRWLSWIPALLSCYPSYRAAVVIWQLCWDKENGIVKKRAFEREVSEIEIFTESVPSFLVMTVFMGIAFVGSNEEKVIVFGSTTFSFRSWFFFTYVTSFISAVLGMSKCLKLGPCRVLEEGGPLGGYCSPKFLLLLLCIGFTLVGKGMPMAAVYDSESESKNKEDIKMRPLITLMSLFLPNVFFSLLAIIRYRSCVEIFKSICSHPSLILLPVFTHFTFSSRSSLCSSSVENQGLVWSRGWTAANVLLSFIGQCVLFLYLEAHKADNPLFFSFGLSSCILGMVLTLLFCFWDSLCCCSCSPAIRLSVLLPEDPLTEFVVGEENQLVRIDIWENEEEEE